MNGLLTPRAVRGPNELVALLRDIKEAVASGILRQIRPDPSPFATDVDVAGLDEHGPWADYLELRFEVMGSPVRYKLAVETYHGAGGTWGPE